MPADFRRLLLKFSWKKLYLLILDLYYPDKKLIWFLGEQVSIAPNPPIYDQNGI